MARNSEKAQSLLYRFKEAQAVSLGLKPSTPTRRPRLASSVSSLKECEKWRADVIRDISRKVSKIQDFGLTDYEVRDLNDEINKLLREKGHWEERIFSLGGANYKRSVPSMMGGDPGASVGRGGYKYFGRAKDLPGVKEALAGGKAGRSGEEADREDRYKRFKNLPGSYYGDEDEDDGVLLAEEAQAEEREWTEKYQVLLRGLARDVRRRREGASTAADEDQEQVEVEDQDMEGDDNLDLTGVDIPPIPRPTPQPFKETIAAYAASLNSEYTVETLDAEEGAKRPNVDVSDDTSAAGANKRHKASDGRAIPAAPQHKLAYSIFSPQDLEPPAVPHRPAVEKMILQARKKQLRHEYVGSN